MLALMGIKMLVSGFYHVPTSLSLGVIAGIISVTLAASYLKTRWENNSHQFQPDRSP